jgi:DUF4097 and DUF4098 domain-containing protein YvlB
VTVHLPIGEVEPLVVDAFSTDLHNFVINLGALEGAVEFRALDLRTTNGGVFAESLYADDARVTTSNGAIGGAFNTSTTLALTTSNAAVRANIGLANDNTLPTALSITTTNGPIDSAISLQSTSLKGSKFRISAQTSNGVFALALPSAPLDATVQLTGVTSNAPARVALPAT